MYVKVNVFTSVCKEKHFKTFESTLLPFSFPKSMRRMRSLLDPAAQLLGTRTGLNDLGRKCSTGMSAAGL